MMHIDSFPAQHSWNSSGVQAGVGGSAGCVLPVHLSSCAAVRTPGIPDCRETALVLDMVCIHVAACDLASAHAGFRTATSASGDHMMACLCWLSQQANSEMSPNPEAAGLFALMEFQLARVMAAAGIQVRGWGPVAGVGRSRGGAGARLKPLQACMQHRVEPECSPSLARVAPCSLLGCAEMAFLQTAHMHLTRRRLHLLCCAVQGSAAQHYLGHIQATGEAALGSVLDWKRTAFWHDPSFRLAWRRARTRVSHQEILSEVFQQNGCASIPILRSESTLKDVQHMCNRTHVCALS